MRKDQDDLICRRCGHYADSKPDPLFGNDTIRICPKANLYIIDHHPALDDCPHFQEKT